MNLEELEKMWEKDSVLDDTLLDEEALKIPQLHSKYLTMYNHFKLLMAKARQEHKTMEHKKWLYYSGKEVPEDVEPMNYKIIRADIPRWMGIDEQMMKLDAKLDYYQVVLDFLAETLKQINNRNYVITNAIQWRRFTSGV